MMPERYTQLSMGKYWLGASGIRNTAPIQPEVLSAPLRKR